MSDSASPPPSPKPLLRSFFFLFGGQSISMLGTQAVQFGLIWWLTVETGSATVVAGATLAALLPRALLGPVAGAIVDRCDRRKVMLVADGSLALLSLVLAALFFTGTIEVWHVLALLLVRGVGELLHESAMLASTSLMVPKDQLTRIQGLVQSLAGLLLIVSPPLGALLVAWLPMAAVVLIDAVTALFAIVPLLMVTVPRPERSETNDSSLWDDTLAGLAYLRRRTGHLALLALAALLNLFLVPAFSLLPLLVHSEGSGAGRLAAASTAVGLGMLVGGAVLGAWGGFERRILTTCSGLVLMGVAVLGVAMAPVTTWAFPMLLGTVGIAATLVNGPVHAILQATVPADHQGRVFALSGSMATIATPIGLVLAAPIAEWLGVRAWFLAGGGMTLLLALVAVVARPIRRIEETAPATPEVLATPSDGGRRTQPSPG
ncbi:MAG: MFS transporter [Acidobacteriota bacterium]